MNIDHVGIDEIDNAGGTEAFPTTIAELLVVLLNLTALPSQTVPLLIVA